MSSKVRYTVGPMLLRHLLALALAAAPLVVGCAASSDETTSPESEAEDEITASQLTGDYGQGRGLYTRLELTRVKEGGRWRNVFEADQVVACVRAPCPAIHVSGSWFASKTFLRLYPQGQPSIAFTAKLTNKTLSLKDAQGHELAVLQRVVAPASNIAAMLAARGISKITVDLPATEAARQAEKHPSAVSFEAALEKALDSFLNDGDDPESPLGIASEVDSDDACHRSTPKATLECFLNDPEATLGMLEVGQSAEHGEKVSDAWIFTVYIGKLSDHGHWAVVDRKGVEATYNYGFN